MPQSRDLEAIYDEHAQAIFGFLLNLTRNEEDTKDLLQDLFTRLSRRPEMLDAVRHPRAYLLRLAHNAAIDLMRRHATRYRVAETLAQDYADLFAESPDPDQAAFRKQVSEALNELPPDQRALVHLKLWEDLTFEQIAEVLNIPQNTAASRYRYGLDKLRARLRPVYDDLK